MFNELLQNNVITYLNISEIKKTLAQSYRLSFGRDNTLLRLSIESAGILCPILVRTNTDKYDTEIITGFRRMEVASSLGIEKIPCILIPSEKTSPLNAFFLNLYDNIAIREFNEVEKALAIRFLVENKISYQEITSEYLPLLGIPPKNKYVDLYFKISSSSLKLKEALASERISVRTFDRLLKLPISCQYIVSGLMLKLKFNINQQLQLIEFTEIIIEKSDEENAITEISKLEHEIIASSFLSDPQKINAILAHLKAMIYPSFSVSKKRFKNAVSSINVPDKVKITHPPFFELSSYSMEINFSSGKELDSIFKKFQQQNIAEKLPDPLDVDEYPDELSMEN